LSALLSAQLVVHINSPLYEFVSNKKPAAAANIGNNRAAAAKVGARFYLSTGTNHYLAHFFS